MKKRAFTIIIIILLFVFQDFNIISSQNPKFDSLADEVNRLSLYKKTAALELLDSLYLLAYCSPDSALLIAHCLYEEVRLKNRHKIVDTLLEKRILHKLAKENIPLQEQALLYYAWGVTLLTKQEYSKAFEIQLKTLEKCKLIQNNLFISKTLNNLGNICKDINLLSLAEDYFSDAITCLTPEMRDYYFCKNNIIITKLEMNEYNVDSLINLIDSAINKGYSELLPLFYLNTGAFLLDTLPEKALIYFDKLNSIDFDNILYTFLYYANMGQYFFNKKEYTSSLYYFKKAQNIMESKGCFSLLSILYKDIALIFTEQNINDSALYYMKKYNKSEEKLRSNIVAIEKHQIEVKRLYEESKIKLTTAEETIASVEKTVEKKNKWIIFVCGVASIVIFLILFFLQRIHIQKKCKENEATELQDKLTIEEKALQKEKRALKYQKEQRKLEHEKLNEIIEKKQKEIISNTMLLTNWNSFSIYFNKTHPKFFLNLKKLFPKLTQENLKMCAFIKMKLTTKQIAQMINISVSSVKMNRNRLKKKLGLSGKDSLDDFISEI